MNTEIYRIELVGGPFDGLSKHTGQVHGDTLSLPSQSTREVGAGQAASTAQHWACYDLVAGQYFFDLDGKPALELRYTFQHLADRQGRVVAAAVDHPHVRWARCRQWLARRRAQLFAWLLAPVDYPLSTHRLSRFELKPPKYSGAQGN